MELTDMFGEIQSPNFPDSYPSDSEMTWNISVPDGFKIKLYFMHFDLESSYLCEYDYVKVSCDISGQMVGWAAELLGQLRKGSAGKAGNRTVFPILLGSGVVSPVDHRENTGKLAASIGPTVSGTPESELTHRGTNF